MAARSDKALAVSFSSHHLICVAEQTVICRRLPWWLLALTRPWQCPSARKLDQATLG